MITIKSEYEINLMRKAGMLVSEMHKFIKPYIKEGITTKELDKLCEDFIVSHDAVPTCKGYEGFPCALCTSVNDMVVHGIPNNYKLKNGDIITIDVVIGYKGYQGDAAWTYAVGEIDSDKVGLIATYEYLYTPSIDSCYEISGYNYGYSNGCGNPQNNWLVSNVTYWTLTPHHSENRVNYVASSGNIYDENTNIVHAVYPVIYLKPTVKILSGTGEVGSNYILG